MHNVLMLLRTPEVQARAREELNRVTEEYTNRIQLRASGQLPRSRRRLPISKRSIPPVAPKPARERSPREEQLLANARRMRRAVAKIQRNK